LALGGRLIIASECAEGLGSQDFVEAQRQLIERGPDRFLQSILLKSHAAIDEWGTQMQLRAMAKGTIQLYSTGLNKELRTHTGVEPIDSIASAVLASAAMNGDKAVVVIPEGPYVVPFYRPGTTTVAMG
jgi:nickel-dependent lactate racemase